MRFDLSMQECHTRLGRSLADLYSSSSHCQLQAWNNFILEDLVLSQKSTGSNISLVLEILCRSKHGAGVVLRREPSTREATLTYLCVDFVPHNHECTHYE
jgi:hypothetical protein